MKQPSLILIAVFGLVMAAFAQSMPSQSQDPNAQPSATQTEQTPSTQPSQSPSNSSPTSTGSDAQRSFVGSITKTGGKFVLHTAGADYQLDDQSQAAKYKDKDVKVTGQ